MKLAVMLPNWVGDACMATPTLRALHRDLPELREFCWIGRPAPLMVLEGLPWSTSQLCYKPRASQPGMLNRRQLIAAMRRKKLDAVLLLTNSLSTALIARLAGIPRRIGYARDARSWLLTDRIPVQDGSADANRDPCIESYLRLAQHLGCSIEQRHTELATTESDRRAADQLFHAFQFDPNRPTLVLNTGAATADTKRWPTEHASQTATQLVMRHGFQILVHCGPAERDVANAIEDQCRSERIRSMGRWESLPLGLSKAVIERSDLVVSTDSGPRHIGIAFNKPVVSLFGSIDPSMTRSFNTPETLVHLGLPCQPCGKHVCPLQHTRCMKDLRAERVVHAVMQRWQQHERRAS